MKRSAGVHRNSRGMTLVELMAGFAILAIVMAVALSMMLFSSNILNVDAARDRMKMLGDDTYNAIQQTLTFATRVEVREGPTALSYAKYENVIYVDTGSNRLYRGTKAHSEPWFAEDAYPNRDVELIMQVKVLDSDTLFLKLTYQLKGDTAEDRIETLYETESAFRIINLSAGTDPVIIDQPNSPGPSGFYVNPLISYDGTPYQIEEGGSGDDELWTGGPYTVAKHWQEGDKYWTWPNDLDSYKVGDIVEYQGKKYEVKQVPNNTVYPPGNPNPYLWMSLEENWLTANPEAQGGTTDINVYSKYDVVSYQGGNYYMAIVDRTPYDPWITLQTNWIPVYWNADKATKADPMLGWSLDKVTYTSVYTKYP